MKRRKKPKPKIDTKKKTGSLAFFTAIPTNFVLGSLCLVAIVALWPSYSFQAQTWVIFALGLLGGISLFAGTSMLRLETFIHELKHAVLVVLSGNRLTDFHVDKGTGHVQYQMHAHKVRFGPFITLAPYFFPLLSLPALIVCMFLVNHNRTLLVFIIGLTLGIDLVTAYKEFHPHQTDLRVIFGGILFAGIFIASANFFWVMFCLLWVLAGNNGFLYLGYTLMRFGEAALHFLTS